MNEKLSKEEKELRDILLPVLRCEAEEEADRKATYELANKYLTAIENKENISDEKIEEIEAFLENYYNRPVHRMLANSYETMVESMRSMYVKDEEKEG